MGGLARQALTIVFSKGVIRLSQLVAFVVLARTLTPAEFGWYGIITSAIALTATLGTLGLRQSYAYEIGQGRLTAGQAIGTSLGLVPIMVAGGTGVLMLIYGRDARDLLGSAGPWIIVLALTGAMLLMMLQGIFLGSGDINSFALGESIPRVVLVAGAVTLGLTGLLTLPNALWLQAATYAVPLPLLVFLALRHRNRIGTAFRRLFPMVRFGLMVAFNLFLVMLSTRVSMFALERLVDADASGQFFAAIRVTEIFLDIATAVGLVLFSHTARSKDVQVAVKDAITIAGWLFWLFLILALPILFVAPTLLTIVVGDEYTDAVPALQILVFSLAPWASHKMIYPTLAGAGHPGAGTPVLITGLALNTILALLLIPSMGITGGAIALVAGQVTLMFGYAIVCRIKFSIPLRSLFLPPRSALVSGWHQLIRRLQRRNKH